MPIVSVIMPAYNAAAYLTPSVQSVLTQTFTDLELLIVDDGSTDGTVAVANAIAAVDSRVRVISQDNAGPGPARNTGFNHARGAYFAFLDSDDQWDPTFLEEQLAILDSQPDVDVVVGNARNRGGGRNGQPTRPWTRPGEPVTLVDMLDDEEALFIMVVFRRRVIERVGGFDPALLTNEEYELWIRAALAGCRFVRNPRPLGRYTCRPGSLSSVDTRMLSGILKVFAKTRPALAAGSRELAALDRKADYFRAELAAAEAKLAIERGDAHTAARHLAELRRYRGGVAVTAAQRMLELMPFAALAAFRFRQRLRRAA